MFGVPVIFGAHFLPVLSTWQIEQLQSYEFFIQFILFIYLFPMQLELIIFYPLKKKRYKTVLPSFKMKLPILTFKGWIKDHVITIILFVCFPVFSPQYSTISIFTFVAKKIGL